MKLEYPCKYCSRREHCDARDCVSWKQWFCSGWDEAVRRLRRLTGTEG